MNIPNSSFVFNADNLDIGLKCIHSYLFFVCLFVLVILIHASLRLRNIKNRLENKIEGVGLKKTPMGMLMDLLDQQEDKINKIQDFFESKVKE